MVNNGRCARVYGLIGIAAKKGSLISGWKACENAVMAGRQGLLILSGDSSAGTKERFLQMIKGNGTDTKTGLVVFGARGELGRRAGKGDRAILIITDTGLAESILKLLGIAHLTGV